MIGKIRRNPYNPFSMNRLLLVGLGGFLGAISRYLLGGWVHKWLQNPWFPCGTLVVNVLGCFVIGLLGGLADHRGLLSSEARMFLLVGLLGGFTTFSSFGYESLALFRDAETWAGLLNIAFHIILGVGAVFVGYKLSYVV